MKYTISFMLLIVAIVCTLMATYVWLFDEVEIFAYRPPLATQTESILGFTGIDLDHDSIEEFVQICGDLKEETQLIFSIYRVDSGKVEILQAIGTGRKSNGRPSSWRMRMDITLAIGTVSLKNHQAVQLGWNGYSDTSGVVGYATQFHTTSSTTATTKDFEWTHRELFKGKLRQGRQVLAFAVGNEKITFDPLQSVGAFAEKNEGQFFVVTVELK